MLADVNRRRGGGTSGQSIGGPSTAMSSKVEAEAHHLLQVESRDYLMMESLIRSRLNRDLEDLDNSFEVITN